MLALEHSRRQQPFVFSGGMDSGFYDPYISQNMNTYASFDSTANLLPMPFSFYGRNPFSAEESSESANLAMFASHFSQSYHPSSPRSELPPPPTLSSASAASVPSNSSSTVGSPYTTHAQPISSQESWTTGNQGLAVGPSITNIEDVYDQSFGGVAGDPDMGFSVCGKVADDFVGEYTNISLIQSRSCTLKVLEQPPPFLPCPQPIQGKILAGRKCVMVDSDLRQPKSAVHPSLVRSSDADSSYITSLILPSKSVRSSSLHLNTTHHSPSISPAYSTLNSPFSHHRPSAQPHQPWQKLVRPASHQ